MSGPAAKKKRSRAESVGNGTFVLAKIKHVMSDNAQLSAQIGQEALSHMAMALDAFVDDLVEASSKCCADKEKKRVGVAEVRSAVEKHDRFDFLKTVQVAEPVAKMPYHKRKNKKTSSKQSEDTPSQHKETNDSSQDKSLFDTGYYHILDTKTSTPPIATKEESDDSDYD